MCNSILSLLWLCAHMLTTYAVIVNNRLHKRDSTKSAELKKLMIFILDTHVSPYSPTYLHVSPYSPTYLHVSPYSPTCIHVSPYSLTCIHVSPYSPTCIHVSPYSPTYLHVLCCTCAVSHFLFMVNVADLCSFG